MKDELINIRTEFFAQILDIQNKKDLEEIRISFLGRNGKIAGISKRIKDLSSEEKKQAGKLINEIKQTILVELETAEERFNGETKIEFDATIPGSKHETGHLHLITQAIQEIDDIFSKIGFIRSRYPEVEWDWFSFESLNFTKNHPARDDWETYWLDVADDKTKGPMLLTPHTSSGQVREMKRLDSKPPIRMLNIGKCYRRQSDVSHTPMFHQFEGLVIDENINITNLKGTLDYFAKNYFGENRVTRLRPYTFPFTEPSFEVDISCDICDGKGCKLCGAGWLELAGAGMVHPNVLKAGGIDPEKYSGFAFGMGVERALMMKSGLKIADLRTLYSTDLRYLKQF